MSDLSPRQWGKGSEEPPGDVKQLKREDGGGYVVRVGRGWWFVAELTDPVPDADGVGWPWENNQVWPLTEVLPEPAKSARGHRNGCQGCDHDPRAYPTCWDESRWLSTRHCSVRPPSSFRTPLSRLRWGVGTVKPSQTN